MSFINRTLDLKTIQDEGWFCGYASVYDVVDSHHDQVMPGAFEAALQPGTGFPKLLWQHDTSQPIGRWKTLREEDKGLYVEGQLFLELSRGKEAFILLKEGEVTGLSIGYQVEKARRTPKGRLLEKVHLYEISLVTFPSNGAARVLGVKHQEETTALMQQMQDLCHQMKEDTRH